MSPSLMEAATRGPQVETLGDAFIRMRHAQSQQAAAELAQAQGRQALTLGDLQNQEAQIKLAQMKRDQEAEERGRALFGGVPPAASGLPTPAPVQTAPAAVAPPAAAPAAPAFEAGAPVSHLGDAATNTPTNPATQASTMPPPAAAPAPPPAGPRPRPTQEQIYQAYGPTKGAAIYQALTKADEAGEDLKTKKASLGDKLQEYEGNLALMVRAADYSPDAIEQSMHMLEDHGYADEAQQFRAHLAQNPGDVKKLYDQAINASPKAREVLRLDAARADAAAAEKRKIDEDAATLAGKKTSNSIQAKVDAGTSATGVSGNQQIVNAETAKRDAASAANAAGHLRIAQNEEKRKTGSALDNLAPNSKAIAEKLARGDFNPAQLGRMPDKEAIMAGAISINPNWTQATYDAKQSFTNPEKSQAKNLGTISRIVGHIERFEKNSKELGYAPAYALGMNQTGGQNKLNADTHAIAAELEKLVSGGVGSQAQTQAWMKALGSVSPEARQMAINEISQLIGSQYEGMNQTYKSAIGLDLPTEKYVSPAGRAWMKAKGINVTGGAATVKMRAPDGTVSDVAADQVEHFQQLGATKVD